MNKNLVILKRLNENSYTKRVLEKLGKKSMDVLTNSLINDPNFDLKSFFKTQKKIHEIGKLEQEIHRMAEQKIGGMINDHEIDGFSAFMISKVLNKLTYEQKERLLSKPTNEIVAISYKLASRTEF